MVVNKGSPNRRRSIAAPSHSQPSVAPRRRRAHSVAPRPSLSPLTKARRSLVPRKSILKASFNADDSQTESQSTLATQSIIDDNNITQSMDLTQDFKAKIHDNTSRKSFGRRVSFAEHAHVRLFEIPETNHTNSTGSPQSSPSTVSPEPELKPQISNENDYKGSNLARRRSSVRYSMSGEDMDLTSVGPSSFLLNSQGTGSAILVQELDNESNKADDDMDVTQVVRGDFARKYSLSMGSAGRVSVPYAPSAILQLSDEPESDADQTRSSFGEDSIGSDAPSDQSQAMEFTVPLNKSLRPPAHEDEAWMALRQATHSGGTPYEPEASSDEEHDMKSGNNEMLLDDAVQRLMRARDSLSGDGQQKLLTKEMGLELQRAQIYDDTISSIDSLEDDNDDGNKTLNLSRVLGRISSGGDDLNRRMSSGYAESSMDESEIYGNIVTRLTTPRRSRVSNSQHVTQEAENQPSASSVFQRPPSADLKLPSATVPKPFSFTPPAPISPKKVKQPSSNTTGTPSKAKPKPVFTAAFAPPVARPSPKKSAKYPAKRSRVDESDIENIDADKPSPAKRQALAGKWLGSSSMETASSDPVNSPKPKPLSPSKKAPFQAVTATTQEIKEPPSALRRPSGYFARRKSLAVGFTNAVFGGTAQSSTSPKKKAGIGMGRVSVGSAPPDAWTRFDKNAAIREKGNQPDSKAIGNQKVVPSVSDSLQQDIPGLGEGPSPPSSIIHSPRRPSPSTGTLADEVDHIPANVDLSEILNGDAFGYVEEEDPMTIDKTEQWREGVEGLYNEGDAPEISISQFFAMTGIKFMDELTAPRRSTHPSQQPTRQPRNPEDIPLSEYVVAMAIDIPQLTLYSRVSKDLEAWMEKSKVVFSQAEEEAAKVTPELFVEYSRADEEGQAELLHQLNFIKTNTRGLAKSDWYDWKLKWVEGLRMTADKAFAELESDARKLEVLIASAEDLVPGLENEYAEIMKESEREEAEVVEIEASDQDYLNELKASIAEQNIEVEALKAEVSERNDQLTWLEERLQETEAQKREAAAAISTAERLLQLQKNSTRSEVFQLKDELEALEDLHMVRVTKVNAQLFEYIYDSTFHISIPCQSFLPILPKIAISRLNHSRTRSKDELPKLNSFFLSCAKEVICNEVDLTVRQVVQRLSDYWSSCSQLRSHLKLLNIKYPVEIETSNPSDIGNMPMFKVRTMVMFPHVMGKAFITFAFPFETFTQWPISIDTLDCEVEVGYGPLDRPAILTAVVDRLAQATPSDNYVLLDACIEAQNVYH